MPDRGHSSVWTQLASLCLESPANNCYIFRDVITLIISTIKYYYYYLQDPVAQFEANLTCLAGIFPGRQVKGTPGSRLRKYIGVPVTSLKNHRL